MGCKLAPLLLAYCLIALFELEETISFAPSIKLLENAVCRKHYAALDSKQAPVNEAFCKTGQIQSQLAYVRGGYGVCKTLPGQSSSLFLILQGLIYPSFSAGIGCDLWKSCRQIWSSANVCSCYVRHTLLLGLDLPCLYVSQSMICS